LNSSLVIGISSTENCLIACDALDDGKIAWRSLGNATQNDSFRNSFLVPLGPPVNYKGKLLCIVRDKNGYRLIEINPSTGDLANSEHDIFLSGESVEDCFQACSPVVFDDTLVCPLPNGDVFGLAIVSGKIAWKTSLNNCFKKPFEVLRNGNLMIIREGHHLWCVDSRTGRVTWSKSGLGSLPISMQDKTMLFTREDQVDCIETGSGVVRWSKAANENDKFTGKSFSANGCVYVPVGKSSIIELDEQSGKDTNRFYSPISLGSLYKHGDDTFLSIDLSQIALLRLP